MLLSRALFVLALALLDDFHQIRSSCVAARTTTHEKTKDKARNYNLEGWTGSKLGTKDYNAELDVIEQGRQDLQAVVLTGREELLCVTFVDSSNPLMETLESNIRVTLGICKWAVVAYKGTNESTKSLCNSSSISKSLVFCGLSEYVVNSQPVIDANGNSTVKSIPKTILYWSIVSYLPGFRRVFLMDEDISLLGFDGKKVLKMLDCVFAPYHPPLISQVLIEESNQYLPYVNLRTWRRSIHRNIVASATGLVEQQIPIFDSVFFEWFIRRVLVKTRKYSQRYGVDWGHDRSWCNAAKQYATNVLHHNETRFVCALLTGASPVHHLNKKTMDGKRVNRTEFRAGGKKVVQKVRSLGGF